jgi:DNA-binding response OmpR family regulator
MYSAKLLIADDDQNIIELLEESFKNYNFQILKADNGYSVISKAKNEHPDLIILDLVMPRLNGYEVCKRLKENPDTQDIKIIILSGQLKKEDVLNLLQLGIKDYFAKPFDFQELIERIKILLKNNFVNLYNKTKLNTEIKYSNSSVILTLNGEMEKTDISIIVEMLKNSIKPDTTKIIFDITDLKFFSVDHINYLKEIINSIDSNKKLIFRISLNYKHSLRANLIKNSELKDLLLLY